MTNLYVRLTIYIAATVAALMLVGFLYVMHLGMEEYICFDRHPWWGPRRSDIECSRLGTRTNIPASFPGRCRSSTPGRSRIHG